MTSEIIHKRSKATLLADEVRTNILAGKLQEGDKLLPDNQLAAHYGISKQTVAAGLNDLVAEGLLERAPGRGTIVISNTGNLDATSNAVGMITMGTGHVYGRLCRHMSKLLIQRGCFPVLINQDLFREASGIRDMLEAMNSERLKPRGFIIEGRYPFPFEYLAEHLAEFPNLVFCNVYHHPVRLPGIKYVLVDYREAGRQVATHFLQRGHRQIIHLAVHENYYRGAFGPRSRRCVMKDSQNLWLRRDRILTM